VCYTATSNLQPRRVASQPFTARKPFTRLVASAHCHGQANLDAAGIALAVFRYPQCGGPLRFDKDAANLTSKRSRSTLRRGRLLSWAVKFTRRIRQAMCLPADVFGRTRVTLPALEIEGTECDARGQSKLSALAPIIKFVDKDGAQ